MLKLSAHLLSILAAVVVCASNSKSRYDHYRYYSVHLETVEHFRLFGQLGKDCSSFTFYGIAKQLGDNITVMVAADKIAHFTNLLRIHRVQVQIINYNIQESIDDEAEFIMPLTTRPSDMNWENYYQLESINNWMNSLIEQYDYITPLVIGKSYENRDICGVKFSKKPGNTGIVVEGGVHAREWISPAVTTFILNQLIHSTEPSVIYLAENFDWYFLPVVNPDGYVYTFEHDRFWRKTRKPYGVCVGADLNRNFDGGWIGSMSRVAPCKNSYPGPTVNSEPESQVLTKFLQNNVANAKIRTYFSLHSYSQYLLFPYAHSAEKVSNHDDLKEFGEYAAADIKKLYGRVFQTGPTFQTIYPSSGTTIDYVYSRLNISIVYAFELRGPPNSTSMFILPAGEIEPSGWETLTAIKTIITNALHKGYYDN